MGDLFEELKRCNVVRGVIASAVVSLLLAGCVIVPLPQSAEQMDSDDLAEFKVGSTTRAEVVRVLEEPLIDDGRFVFDQLYSDTGGLFMIAEGGAGTRRFKERHTRVLLEFDESDILKSMAFEAWSRAGSVESVTTPDRPATAPELSGEVLTHGGGSRFKVPSSFKSVSFSPTGGIVAVSDTRGRIFLIDVENRTLVPFDPVKLDPRVSRRGSIDSVTFSPDGNSLAFLLRLSRTIQIFDVGTRTEVVISGRRKANVFAFVPNENLIVSGGRKGFIRVWQTRTGKEIASWRASEKRIYSVAISSDGELLATSDKDGFVRLWDRRSGAELGVVRRDGVVAFSPDGKFLAIASDARAELWRLVRDISDPSPGRGIRLEGPRAMFVLPFLPSKGELKKWKGRPSLSFTPDSRMLVVGAGVAVIWDVVEGRRLWRFLPGIRYSRSFFSGNSILDLAISPDGQTMVTASGDGVRFWKLPSMTED